MKKENKDHVKALRLFVRDMNMRIKSDENLLDFLKEEARIAEKRILIISEDLELSIKQIEDAKKDIVEYSK